MDQFLFLSHLDYRIAYSDPMLALAHGNQPPNPEQVTQALQQAGVGNARQRVTKACEAAVNTAFYLSHHPSLRVVSRWSPLYPALLQTMPYPPWFLYYCGSLPCPKTAGLAIVGTRRPNLYGKEVIQSLLPQLKGEEIQVISGLAEGIDTLAHCFSCNSGLRNFAVLANGLDHIYPASNRDLAANICQNHGGILSEFPPGTRARKDFFPWRNRIISAFANVVWIVQGTRRSGSRHTGDHAASQGRTICVTPGDIFSELSEIAHDFLKNGATPVFEKDDLLMALALSRAHI